MTVSLPLPPFRVSSPPSPLRRLSPLLPVSVSLKLLPMRFSKFNNLSLPAPPVFCAPNKPRLTATPAEALR
ncbi:MAG: hypothetical protein CTY16_17525 [Methylobacter sp.]|nr:MAG: hypothetical protein CTY16_17525 [Methylobacter sp.]